MMSLRKPCLPGVGKGGELGRQIDNDPGVATLQQRQAGFDHRKGPQGIGVHHLLERLRVPALKHCLLQLNEDIIFWCYSFDTEAGSKVVLQLLEQCSSCL